MNREQDMTCEQALALLARYLDGELVEGTGQNVERHLDRCRSCFSRAEFERRLRERVASVARQEVGAEFAERIRDLLARFTVPPRPADQ